MNSIFKIFNVINMVLQDNVANNNINRRKETE